MTTSGGAEQELGEGSWAGEAIVLCCAIVTLIPMGLLHTSGIGWVDPLTRTISDYIVVPGGYALLGVAAISLAVAGAVLAGGLRRSGLARPELPAVLLRSGSVALVLVALFPTHHPDEAAGLVATVHRAAGGWVLVAVPLAAWLVARRARLTPEWAPAAPALTWVAGATGLLSLWFLLSHVPIVIGASPGFPLVAEVQRVLYAAVILVLVVTARATRLAVERALETSGTAVQQAGPELRSAT